MFILASMDEMFIQTGSNNPMKNIFGYLVYYILMYKTRY